MDEKKKNTRTIFFVILGTLIVVAAIIIVTVAVTKANSVHGQLIGTWKDEKSSYTISFDNFGNANVKYTNTKFVLNKSSENEAKTEETKIDGNYSVDENNQLNINIKGAFNNASFPYSEEAKSNSDYWCIEDNHLYLNGKTYIR